MPSLSSTLTFLGFAALVAANCNPSYTIAGYGDCTKQCKEKAGRDLYADWTDDPTSPNFIESLKYKCEKGFPAYTTFMTVSGTCLMSCSESEQKDYGREHAESCAWYAEHKNDTCAGDNATPSSNESGSAASSGAGAEETSSSGGNGGNGGSNGSNGSSNAGADADADSQEDGESAATKLQLGSLVVAAVAAGSALLL